MSAFEASTRGWSSRLRTGKLEVSSTRELEAEAIVVWSLGPHWSWGFAGVLASNQS